MQNMQKSHWNIDVYRGGRPGFFGRSQALCRSHKGFSGLLKGQDHWASQSYQQQPLQVLPLEQISTQIPPIVERL